MNDELLIAWLKMSQEIKGNRLLSEFSLNEMMACHYIFKSNTISASDLCEEMNLLKSQMNRTLGALEKKGYIIRKTNDLDKRKMNIEMTALGIEAFQKEHLNVKKIISQITGKLGDEKSNQLAELMLEAVKALKDN